MPQRLRTNRKIIKKYFLNKDLLRRYSPNINLHVLSNDKYRFFSFLLNFGKFAKLHVSILSFSLHFICQSFYIYKTPVFNTPFELKQTAYYISIILHIK